MGDGSGTDDQVKKGEIKSRELAGTHYENFAVSSFFQGKKLRQDHYNIYAFCRLADDFADEGIDKYEASSKLDRWQSLLVAAACEDVSDPLFAALGDTIQRRRLSLQPFLDLLSAFKLDLVKSRYKTWNELRDYTRLSADPVGRIILELHGQNNPDYFALSDSICTALQLANHWQDVSEDFNRGRIYIPEEDMRRFSITEKSIEQKCFTSQFQKLMEFEIQRAKTLFNNGKKLLKLAPFPLNYQLALYWNGGMSALNAILRVKTDIFNQSARLNKLDKLVILFKSLSYAI